MMKMKNDPFFLSGKNLIFLQYILTHYSYYRIEKGLHSN